jgi:hypothetical protein
VHHITHSTIESSLDQLHKGNTDSKKTPRRVKRHRTIQPASPIDYTCIIKIVACKQVKAAAGNNDIINITNASKHKRNGGGTFHQGLKSYCIPGASYTACHHSQVRHYENYSDISSTITTTNPKNCEVNLQLIRLSYTRNEKDSISNQSYHSINVRLLGIWITTALNC